MDVIDRAIVGALLDNARRSIQDVADHVDLSASATRERMRRLEDSGVIMGYTARLDPASAGLTIEAVVDVDMAPDTDPLAFESRLRDMPAVTEALHATGAHDYIVRVSCHDTAELHQVVRSLKADVGAERTVTRVVLDEVVPPRARLDR
jgi:Lrp/AsnC family leucine-responsive transcriptional regulator